MTVGDRIWAEAISEVGATEIWADSQRKLAELGFAVIRRIDRALATLPLYRTADADDDTEGFEPW